jgi:hypothetical protein
MKHQRTVASRRRLFVPGLVAAAALAFSAVPALLHAAAPARSQQQPSAGTPELPDPIVLAAAVARNAKRILVDFEQEDLNRWSRASSRADSKATYAVVPVPGGGRALHAVIPDFAEWDNISKGFLPAQPFTDGHTLTCFRAKGRPETRRLVVEWQEKDTSRWIASVELGTEWKDYALPPEAFRPWLPPAGRGGPGDRFRVENAVRFQIGLATSHSELRPASTSSGSTTWPRPGASRTWWPPRAWSRPSWTAKP